MNQSIIPKHYSQLAHDGFLLNAKIHANQLTVEHYAEFLDLLSDVADIVPLRNLPQKFGGRATVGIRFDIDGDAYTALHLARAEHDRGIPSTYFFLPTAWHYGKFDGGLTRYSGIFDQMIYMQDVLGREIGYHDDCMLLLGEHGVSPEQSLREELDLWRSKGIRVDGICSHNTACVYGVGSFEVWEGQSIEGRTSAVVNDRPVRLGNLRPADFGLTYDANFSFENIWSAEPFEWRDRSWPRNDRMRRDIDYAFVPFDDGTCFLIDYEADPFGRETRTGWNWKSIIELIREKGPGKRWLLFGHPKYYGGVPTLPSVPNHYDQWLGSGLRQRVCAALFTWPWVWPVMRILAGSTALRSPTVIRNRIRFHSRRNGETRSFWKWWENDRPGTHFMKPFVEKTFNLIRTLAPDLHRSSLLDLAGGCGNLGLGLLTHGLGDYVLNDIHAGRLTWSRQLFSDFGFNLTCCPDDIRTMQLPKTFDFVSILAWENFDVSYEQAIAAARRHQELGGWLVMTFKDFDEYHLGGFEAAFQKTQGSSLPRKDNHYLVVRHRFFDQLRRYGYQVHHIDKADDEPAAWANGWFYPQYLLCARLVRETDAANPCPVTNHQPTEGQAA